MEEKTLLGNKNFSQFAGASVSQPEMLNDLMLDLHIEVGRAKIKISQLLNMTQGEIIQLEQKSSDPLIIYANDKAIARGQIISSNGQYNIRIL